MGMTKLLLPPDNILFFTELVNHESDMDIIELKLSS